MMKILMMTLLFFATCYCGFAQEKPHTLTEQDMKALGTGTIMLKDRSVIKNIILQEVREYSIVFIKNGSLHDLMLERIERIEFSKSPWGIVKIEFPDHKLNIVYTTLQEK